MDEEDQKRVAGTLDVQLNLDRPLADLQRVLRDAITMAAVGLRGVEEYEGPLELPDVWPQISLGKRPPPEAAKSLFRRWLVGSLLRDCIESLEGLLWDIWRIAQFVTLLGPDGRVKGRALKEFFRSQDRFKDRKTLGQKLQTLRKDFPELLPARWEKSLDGLLNLRNCLTHGRGAVRQRDLTSPKRLVISWRVMTLQLIESDGNIHRLQGLLGELSPVGDFQLVQSWRRRMFRVGDKPQLSVQEFAEVALSLWLFALELRQLLASHLREHGVPVTVDLTPKLNVSVVDLSSLVGIIHEWAERVGVERVSVARADLTTEGAALSLFVAGQEGQELPSETRREWERELAGVLGREVTVASDSSSTATIQIYPPKS